jgi:hypothetical protein
VQICDYISRQASRASYTNRTERHGREYRHVRRRLISTVALERLVDLPAICVELDELASASPRSREPVGAVTSARRRIFTTASIRRYEGAQRSAGAHRARPSCEHLRGLETLPRVTFTAAPLRVVGMGTLPCARSQRA